MKFLVIDTCGAEGSFALIDSGANNAARLVTMPGRSASEMLVRLLRETTAEIGWKTTEIGVIGVVTGPGSFTGVRIGLSVAKGLSEAIGASLIAVSRLELLASRVESGSVCALLDAGRGQFYCGTYRDSKLIGESLISPEDAIEASRGADRTVLCEDSVEKKMQGTAETTRVPEPTAEDALPLVLKRFHQGEFADSASLDANYLRRTDAEIFSSPPRK